MEFIRVESGRIKSFQLKGEPEVIHVIKHRDNEYYVLFEDFAGINLVERTQTKEELEAKLGISLQ